MESKDLDEKERRLEEQQNRVQSLSNVLAKQQNATGIPIRWFGSHESVLGDIQDHPGIICEAQGW